MPDLLTEMTAALARLQDQLTGVTTIAAMDDYPNGGDFEAEVLPAVFVGDAGESFQRSGFYDVQYVTDATVFVSVIVERKAGAFAQSQAILNAVINALLYDNSQQWLPSGCEFPFVLSDNRPPALYFNTFVMRNLIFNQLKL